jgi:hypothetical protein
MQAIQDGFEANEGFGKEVMQHNKQPKSAKNFKKILSVESFNGNPAFEHGAKKSFSTSTFDENDFDNYYQRKTKMSYAYEDQSTMASLSALNSVNSFSSGVSVSGTNYNNNKSKTKFNPNNKKKVNPGETDFRMKYKTEVCKYWAEKGFCEFGDQCAFAHGKREIRQKVHISSNYKTKKCVQFHEHGFCPYGVRCQFIHCARKDHQLNPILINGSYAQDLDNAEIWCNESADCVCMRRKNRPRLPILEKVSTDYLYNENSQESTPDSKF